MAEASGGGFLTGLGQTLLRGINIAIDGEAGKRYPNQGGQVATQDREGNLNAAGAPFRETIVETVKNPVNLVMLGVAAVLVVVLVKRL